MELWMVVVLPTMLRLINALYVTCPLFHVTHDVESAFVGIS